MRESVKGLGGSILVCVNVRWAIRTVRPNGDVVWLPLERHEDAADVMETAKAVGSVHPDVVTIEVHEMGILPPI